MTRKYSFDAGFTLIEFMIASVVFSTLLLGVTAAVLYIQGTYQRSLYTSNTQQVTGNVVDVISDAIKFSNADVSWNGASNLCVGNRQFTFVLGRRVDSTVTPTSTRHGLISQPNSGCVAPDVVNTATIAGSQDFLDAGLRLIKLDITPDASNPSLWTVTARVGYGEDDVFCSPSIATGAGSCTRGADPITSAQLLAKRDLECHPQKLRYCAVSELSTTVFRRL